MSWTLNAWTPWPGRNPDFTSAASDTAAATINNAADETNTRFIRRSSIVPVRNSVATRLPVSVDSIASVDGLSRAGEWDRIKNTDQTIRTPGNWPGPDRRSVVRGRDGSDNRLNYLAASTPSAFNVAAAVSPSVAALTLRSTFRILPSLPM